MPKKSRIEAKRIARVFIAIRAMIDTYVKADEDTRVFIDTTLADLIERFNNDDKQD